MGHVHGLLRITNYITQSNSRITILEFAYNDRLYLNIKVVDFQPILSIELPTLTTDDSWRWPGDQTFESSTNSLTTEHTSSTRTFNVLFIDHVDNRVCPSGRISKR